MTTLSKSDQELVKLRAAKMSTKTIAMLMGGRWTEARVYNRLAQIDGQAEATAPDLPVLHRVDEDLPEGPAPPKPLSVGDFCAALPACPEASGPFLVTPWAATQLAYLASDAPSRPSDLFLAGSATRKTQALLAVFAATSVRAPKPVIHIAPAEELPDAGQTSDQPSPGADAAPDPKPTDAAPEAGALHADPAQAGGDQALEGKVSEEILSPAPNPLAVEARPFIPVHKVHARKAPRAVARPAPNLLATPPSPPSRPSSRGGATRLKPLTERVARWAGHFMWAGWDLFEIAELFDVSPEALEKVLT